MEVFMSILKKTFLVSLICSLVVTQATKPEFTVQSLLPNLNLKNFSKSQIVAPMIGIPMALLVGEMLAGQCFQRYEALAKKHAILQNKYIKFTAGAALSLAYLHGVGYAIAKCSDLSK